MTFKMKAWYFSSTEGVEGSRQNRSFHNVSDSREVRPEERIGSRKCREVADSNSKHRGAQTEGRELHAQIRRAIGAEQSSRSSRLRDEKIQAEQIQIWPSRPGEEQYHWEEPRTIESGLGRAANGASSRVDRLRLLGNGVVPQTAAKAWETLTTRR